MKIKWKPLLLSIAAALAAGGLSGLLVRGNFSRYQVLRLPPGAPPSWLFPLVWAILYLLMGVSAYLIWESKAAQREQAIFLYTVQLAVNFLWAPLFFGAGWILFAFLWLLFLLYLVGSMIWEFYRIEPLAAYLQLPYLVWLLFAAYLNIGVWLLNRI